MNEYDVYKLIEFMIFAVYLGFIFLSIQILLLWRDTNKNELDIKSFVNESFFKKNCIYIFTISVFFMSHEVIEAINPSNAMIYFEFFELLGFISIVLFAYDWYAVLRVSMHKKTLPQELTESTKY